jgi:O-antigen/teichoic acid export membrane protein
MASLYGTAFGDAGDVFQILSFAYVLLALGMFFGNILIASDRQQAYFPPLLASAAIAVVGNVLLIPRWQALGACWAMLAAHATLFSWTAWICRRLLTRHLLRPLVVSGAASLVMAIVLRLPAGWPVLALMGLGAVVYLGLAAPFLWSWARTMRTLS